MNDVVRFLDQGNLTALIILALMLALIWAVKQWRLAEAEKDSLHEARLDDAKEFAALGVEVKNTLTEMLRIAGEK